MPTQFAFLVLPQIHLMDLAGPDQSILESIGFGADFSISYCGIDQAPESSTGLKLSTPPHFSDTTLKQGDYLVLPGSNVNYLISDDFKKQAKLLDWIIEQYQKGVNIISICAGAFILGQCGLLNGKACTTHFKRTQQLQELYPKALVKDNILFVEDSNIFSSAGIASGIDLMLFIIEKLKGSYFAHKVAREMVIYFRRDGLSQQNSNYLSFRNHLHNGIHQVQDYIVENISQKHKLSSLAELACMSERNFTRVFKKETGITIHTYIQSIRIEQLKILMKNPDLSRTQMANAVGLNSEKQLYRLMQFTAF